MMLTVATADSDHRQTALSFLFAGSSPTEQAEQIADVLEAHRRGEVNLDGLLLAEVNGQPAGAALFIMQPDDTAFIWLPVVSDDQAFDVESVRDGLFVEICQRIDAAGVWLGQCIVETDQTADRETLVRHDFFHLADLSYLHRSFQGQPLPAADVDFETIRFDASINRDRFAGLLERTYVGTLDCPALNGIRSGAEALASHQQSGEFDPARWKIYRTADADVGVLLFNDQPDQNAWELVYTGVVPEARGKGYGRAMLLCGLHEASRAARGGVLLAVDRRNTYARNVYCDLGFIELAVRAVHVRTPLRGREIL